MELAWKDKHRLFIEMRVFLEAKCYNPRIRTSSCVGRLIFTTFWWRLDWLRRFWDKFTILEISPSETGGYSVRSTST